VVAHTHQEQDQEGIVATLFENVVFQINAEVEGHTRPRVEMQVVRPII
jgi:hypothetical protein